MFDLAPDVQTHVRRHLVVPAASRVQLFACLPDLFDENAFHKPTDILVNRRVRPQLAVKIIGEDPVESVMDLLPTTRSANVGLSSVPLHSVVLMTEIGSMIRNESFLHQTNTENTEEIVEGNTTE